MRILLLLFIIVDIQTSFGKHILHNNNTSEMWSSINHTGEHHKSSTMDTCYRSVNSCEKLNSSICLDVSLPYEFTSAKSPLIIDLDNWKGLRIIPHCWKALQTVLCATFNPRCDKDPHPRVILPTDKMCRLTRESCRLIDPHFQWPEFLQCDNEAYYSANCSNMYMDLKPHQSSPSSNRCTHPFVHTDDNRTWYPDIDGCALHCINPIYTEEQHQQISNVIFYGIIFSLLFSSFSVVTFMLDKTCLKRRFYTSIIFYINLSILLSTFGWSIQFFKSVPEVVCRPDNTIRYGEPHKSGNNFFCCLSFFLIYYFSLAALIWFVHLFKVFYQTFNGLSTGIKMNFNRFQYHVSAWSVPLFMTLLVSLFNEIDGDSLRGICFVGVLNSSSRFYLLWIPLSIGLTMAIYHSIQTIRFLLKTKQSLSLDNSQKNSSKRMTKINMALIRIISCTIMMLVVYLVIFSTYLHELQGQEANLKNFNDYLICNMNLSSILFPKNANFSSSSPSLMNNSFNDGHQVNVNCGPYVAPNIGAIYIQLVAIFASSLLASSWIWTRATVSTWKRFFARHFSNKDPHKLRSLKPYESMAEACLKREQIQHEGGGLGYYPACSFISHHHDPVDMDLNSASVSVNLRHDFPALLDRRNAICAGGGANQDIFYRNSRKEQYQHHHHFLQSQNAAAAAASFLTSQNLSISDTVSQQVSFESMETNNSDSLDFHNNRRRIKKKERDKRKWKNHRNKKCDSDTSASIVSNALIKAMNQQTSAAATTSSSVFPNVTKSTSTGDLLNMVFGTPHPTTAAAYNPYMMAAAAALIHPQAQVPFPVAAWNNGHQPMPPIQPPPTMNSSQPATNHQSVRMNQKQRVETFAFTHGMSDQSGHCVNPMAEKRRPDSGAASSSTTFNNNHNNNTKVSLIANQCSNLVIVNQQATPGPIMAAAANPYHQMMATPFHYPPTGTYPHQYPMIPPVAAPAPPPPNFPRYYNTQAAFLMYQQSKPLAEMEQLLKEHEKFKQLITAHQSDTESLNSEQYLQINISDSDTSRNGFYSDDRELLSKTEIVKERIKMVEDQQQQQEEEEEAQKQEPEPEAKDKQTKETN